MPRKVTSLKSNRSLYQLNVSLVGSAPLIWRRILVANDMPLMRFHEALQIVMGWQDCHLHQFIAGDVCYGMPDPDFPSGMKSEARIKVKGILPKKGVKAIYEYDLGDGWEHDLVLEEVLPVPDEPLLPLCLAGERACPPEDSGGMPGYEALLESINDPAHPDHADTWEWLGGDFDPERFDLPVVNFRLGQEFGKLG